MQITIAARHGHLSDAAQQVIREKALKLTHFFERLTMIEITVDLKDEVKIAGFLRNGLAENGFVRCWVRTGKGLRVLRTIGSRSWS